MKRHSYFIPLFVTLASLAVIYHLFPETFTRRKQYVNIRLQHAIKIIRGRKGDADDYTAF